MNSLIRHLALFAMVMVGAHAEAKRFRNAYVSFELPPNWTCKLERTQWLCVNQFSQKAKEAVIILTAKEVGPTDSLSAYLAYVKSPRTNPGTDNRPFTSKVIHAKERQIAGHTWVDGLQEGSEISSYYTRYLATIKEKIAILVTFSAHRSHYTKYSSDFIKAVESLRVVATKDLLSDRPQVPARQGNETIGAPIGSSIPVDLAPDQVPAEPSGAGGSTTEKLLGLVLLLAAFGTYFVLASRKKQPPKKGSGPKK